MYKIAVCDDVSVDIDNIVEIIRKKANESNIFGIEYFLYNNGDQLLKYINEKFDVIFLDIQMELRNGKEVAELIRNYDSEVIIVFCTGLRAFTPDIFKVQPYRYITKQFMKKQMEIDIKEVLDKMISSSKKYILTIKNGRRYKINLNDILYIALIKRGCEIYINSEVYKNYGCEKICCEESLKSIYELIDDHRFVYAHNSYIINIEHILKATRTEVVLNNNIRLTVARSKEDALRKQMMAYFGNKCNKESKKI